VQIAKNRIADLEKRAQAEALQQPLSGRALTPAEAERQKRLSRRQGELESIDREIQAKRAQLPRAQAALAEYERRVQAAPGVGTQLDEVMRNYASMQTSYDQLVKKLQDARLAASVEQRQVGEQLRIIDPASRPQSPHSPNRVRLNIIGAMMGLGLGLAIAGLLEYRDTSLRTQEDVVVALSLPVLALVPTIRTQGDDRRQLRRRRTLLIGSSAAMLAVSLVAVAWKLRLFEGWGG